MTYFRNILIMLLGLSLGWQELYATHIKAADLYATINPTNSTEPNSHRKVRFTLTVYCRKETVDASDRGNDCGARLGNCVTLDFGDGRASGATRFSSLETFNNDTYQFIYYFDHEYPSDRLYRASYYDENRNANIENLLGPTDRLPFYIEMGVRIQIGLGLNQTPKMSIPPIDLGETFRAFVHNPGAFDINGDSISYERYFPQVLTDVEAPGYKDPNLAPEGGTTQDGRTPTTYTVDSLRGDVRWDAPVRRGLYNVAFLIKEWRTMGSSKELLSYTIRDMQIEIRDGLNRQPIIRVPEDICVSANSTVIRDVFVTDPDGDRVNLDLFGELKGNSAINFPAANPILSGSFKTFTWRTSCSDVRKRPYQAFFKATDIVAQGLTSLADIKSFFIYVVAPRATNLKSRVDGKNIVLSWDQYSCPNAYQMQIYRRVGCDTIQLSNCQTGAPDGYVLIGQVGVNQTTFTDINVQRGNEYSYLLVASFLDEVKLLSYSYPSAATCASLPLITPIVTRVSFEGPNKDALLVSWIKPLDTDTNVKAPYTYELYRQQSGASSSTLIRSFGPDNVLTDSSFLDTSVDPNTNYSYFVRLLYNQMDSTNLLIDSSETSSSVALVATGISKGVNLGWQAKTAWSNGISTLFHYIWRKRETDNAFVLIDSVAFLQNSLTYSYSDVGKQGELREKETISYFVTTSGSYQNPRIIPFVTRNNSFIVTAIVQDVSPPCPPILDAIVYDCETFKQSAPYFNALTWHNSPFSLTCDSDIAGYKIYYSTKRDENPIPFLIDVTSPLDTFYKHENLGSVSACYTVTAIDSSGNQSAQSNKVCVEACKRYELPNVFTPNNAGTNEIFRPLPPSPLSVESVDFKVFNRWGQKVFERKDDILLNWDGAGMPDGVYFYSAKVKFTSLDQEDLKEIKGWVQIIR